MGQLFSFEGRAAAMYWDHIKYLVQNQSGFPGRIPQGCTDLFNHMLNYGYAILYSRIWTAIIKSKLNPYISYLHKPRPGEPGLVFDLIETFRPHVVDGPVIALVTKHKNLKLEKNKLDDCTRKLVARAVLNRLNRFESFRKKELMLKQIIDIQIADFASCLQDPKKIFKPYIGKW